MPQTALGVTRDDDLTTAVLEVVNKLFLDNLKQSHGEWLLGEEQAMIPARRLIKSSMSFLCQYIITTWHGISPKVTVKWFKSGVYPLSNDNMWWNDSE